jgi:hypothetical protein
MSRVSWGALAGALLVALFPGGARAAPTPAPDFEERSTLQIDLGRTGVLIDRALDGFGVALPNVLEDRGDEAELAALWRALRQTGREGVILKELACAKSPALRKACRAFKRPAWIEAEPAPVPALAVLRERADALYSSLEPFIDAGCKAGVRRTKDAMFCSVE